LEQNVSILKEEKPLVIMDQLPKTKNIKQFCTNTNQDLIDMVDEMSYEDLPERIKSLKIDISTTVSSHPHKLIRTLEKDESCYGLDDLECMSSDDTPAA
jgi:hypothetical protein